MGESYTEGGIGLPAHFIGIRLDVSRWYSILLCSERKVFFEERQIILFFHRVPTRTGKPRKMGRHFPVREKSGNFEQTGKVRKNHTKYWKTQGI